VSDTGPAATGETTETTAVLPAGGGPPVAAPDTVPVTPGGRTTITPLVVERLASRAAFEVVAGRPRAAARLDGRIARIELTVSLPYPAPVRDLARRVRSHVAATVDRLAGVDAREVDLVVGALEPAAPRHRRVR
jgi:hypothetical protein